MYKYYLFTIVFFSSSFCSRQITSPEEGLFIAPDRPPSVKKALEMRGQSFSDIQKELGAPADEAASGRRFWFLSDETGYHPNPQPRLYELLFDKENRLIDVRLGVTK